MLVLARKKGERLMIGEDIVIAVISIDRGVVRLGIEAPREVVIAREEVLKHFDGRLTKDAADEIHLELRDTVVKRIVEEGRVTIKEVGKDGTEGTTVGGKESTVDSVGGGDQ